MIVIKDKTDMIQETFRKSVIEKAIIEEAEIDENLTEIAISQNTE